jgi:hypothetical protein
MESTGLNDKLLFGAVSSRRQREPRDRVPITEAGRPHYYLRRRSPRVVAGMRGCRWPDLGVGIGFQGWSRLRRIRN